MYVYACAYQTVYEYIRLACRLQIKCSSNLSTSDLETEVFVHILQNCLEYVDHSQGSSEAAAAAFVSEGDGMSG